MDNNSYDVIVIGAGAAGLMAAKEIVNAGKSVCVLEARDRVGGRIKAGMIAGEVIDHGGMWMNQEQIPLIDLAALYDMAVSPQPVVGNSILDLSHKKNYFNPEQMGLPFFSNLTMYLAVRRAEYDASLVTKGAPWKAEQARKWDSESLQYWIDKHLRTKIARDYFETSMRIEMSAEPSQISYLYFLDLLSAEQGTDVSQGQWSHKLVGGMHALFQKMADELSDQIILSAEVTDISQDERGVQVCTNDKGDYHAQYVINTAPPRIAAKINYSPRLPAKLDTLMQNTVVGAAIKCYIAYDTPFWRERELSGLIVNNTSPVTITLDATPEGSDKGILVGMMVGAKALEASEYTVEERKQAFVNLLVDNFGPEAAHPIDYIDNDWSTERWTRGGYAGHLPTGVLTMLRSGIYKETGRVHWAGTERGKKWNGLISGALESGQREALRVIDKIK